MVVNPTRGADFLSLIGEVVTFIILSAVGYFLIEYVSSFLLKGVDNSSISLLSSYVIQCVAYGGSIYLINRYIFPRQGFLTGLPGYKPLLSFIWSAGLAGLILGACFVMLYGMNYLGAFRQVWDGYEF